MEGAGSSVQAPVHTRAVLTRRRAASRPQKAPSAEAEAPAAAAAPAACSDCDDDEDLAFTSKKKKKKRPMPVGSGLSSLPLLSGAPSPLGAQRPLGSATARHPRYPGAGAAGSGWRAALASAPHSGAASGRATRCMPSGGPRHGHEPRPTVAKSASLCLRKSKAPAAEAEPAGDDDDDDDEVGFATGGGDDDDDDDDDDDGDDDGGDDALVGEGGFMSIPAGREYKYEELLDRMYSLLIANNPELAGDRRKFLMKPPQVTAAPSAAAPSAAAPSAAAPSAAAPSAAAPSTAPHPACIRAALGLALTLTLTL